ncbi:MAG: methyltransferase domain-containing protein [Chloroflexia bacterium]
MVSPELFEIVRCPLCRDEGLLKPEGEALRCLRCGGAYACRPGYLDLLPPAGTLAHTSRYIVEQEEMAAALDYRRVGPPLLAAGVRQRMLQKMLRPQKNERVLDCGCGNGRFALWNRASAGLVVGLDPATLFADAALEQVDLVRGDARRLPFASGSFDKAFSIDVLEHLTRPDIEAVLDELWRILRPGGRLLIYSNTREPSSLQPIISLWRRLGRLLRRWKRMPDPDAHRKADHVKAVATFDELRAIVEEAGFRPLQVRFWNSVFTSFVEHVLLPAFLPSSAGPGGGGRPDRERWRERAGRRGWFYRAARALTGLMGLDLALFGRLRAGSYFLLLERC